MSEQHLLATVQKQYGAVAQSQLGNDSAAVRSVASAFGYSPQELASLPTQANMGLSCGNPTAFAGLRPGETVVDLGCGGGLDVFLAARQVGPQGRAIGIDMTPEMIQRAETGAREIGAANTEFHLARIDQMPLADASVDCVVSNCVINLVPDKPRVFREILRVLKPGGRVAISDIALRQTLPEAIRDSMEAYVGCISGAILLDEYRRLLESAGFQSVVVSETGSDLNAYAHLGSASCCGSGACCEPEETAANGGLPVLQNFDANAYAASVRIHALKRPSPGTANRQ